MMNNPGDYMFGGMSTIIFLFLFVLAVLWFILPFAIFGTKGKLDELIAETQKMNHQLAILIGSSNDRDKSKVIEGSNTQPIKDEDPNLNTEADRAKILVNTLDAKKRTSQKILSHVKFVSVLKQALL